MHTDSGCTSSYLSQRQHYMLLEATCLIDRAYRMLPGWSCWEGVWLRCQLGMWNSAMPRLLKLVLCWLASPSILPAPFCKKVCMFFFWLLSPCSPALLHFTVANGLQAMMLLYACSVEVHACDALVHVCDALLGLPGCCSKGNTVHASQPAKAARCTWS